MNVPPYVLQERTFEDANPCFGCISMACRKCPCFEERMNPCEYDTRRERTRNKRTKKRHPSVVQKTEEEKRKITITPRGIFGTVGYGVVLQADGDGMCNAGIHTGDWLIFDTGRTLKDGDIAIVGISGAKERVICRRVLFEGDRKRIRREDGETADIVVDECRVYAVMAGIVHGYTASIGA